MLGGWPGNRIEPLEVGIESRERVHEPDRVRVPRAVEDLVDVGELDHPSRVHDDDAIGELGDEPEVVRDQDGRGVGLVLRRLHDLDDLRLDRDVERGRRLVGDEDPRFVGDRHRDHRALSHAARELVRVLVDAPFGERHAHELEQLDGPLVRRLVADARIVRLDRLRDLVPDREHRVQRRHRILEDHCDLTPADVAELLLRQRQEISLPVARLATNDAAGRLRDQAEHGHHRDALPRAGLADDAERLAGEEVVGDVRDGVDDAVLRLELDRQPVDGENGVRHGYAAGDRARRAGRRR